MASNAQQEQYALSVARTALLPPQVTSALRPTRSQSQFPRPPAVFAHVLSRAVFRRSLLTYAALFHLELAESHRCHPHFLPSSPAPLSSVLGGWSSFSVPCCIPLAPPQSTGCTTAAVHVSAISSVTAASVRNLYPMHHNAFGPPLAFMTSLMLCVFRHPLGTELAATWSDQTPARIAWLLKVSLSMFCAFFVVTATGPLPASASRGRQCPPLPSIQVPQVSACHSQPVVPPPGLPSLVGYVLQLLCGALPDISGAGPASKF